MSPSNVPVISAKIGIGGDKQTFTEVADAQRGLLMSVSDDPNISRRDMLKREQEEAKKRLIASFSPRRQTKKLVIPENQATPTEETPPLFTLSAKTKVISAEERARLAAEAEAAAKAKQEEEEAAEAEKARPNIVPQDSFTPTDEGESDEEKQQRIKNQVLSEIIDNNALDEKTLAELWADLWEDFSSNQNYTTNDTTNTTNAISSNNTNDSTSEKQKSIAPTRAPLPENKYTAKLTPKTYYGVGIKTQLVQEENQKSYLKITQFYDDSGFKSALEAKQPPIETANQNIKITAIECDLDGTGKKYYSIDEIFEKCEKGEMNFNLKLCDIFRNLKENELKLKFSIDGDLQDQDLNIKKSVFTKGENNGQYENIKTVIQKQTAKRQQNQTQPSVYPSDPQILGRPVDIAPPTQFLVG